MSSPNFGYYTTADEVISALGSSIAAKTILITGPTPGSLGATTIERLASHPSFKPAHIILLGRSEQKTQSLITKLHDLSPETKTTFIPIELSSLVSVRTAASAVLSLNTKIDTIINNAGIMALRNYTPTSNGIESQFAVNHLSHFLLTNLLIPILAPNARIINISSEGHALGQLTFPSTPLESWTKDSVARILNFDDGKDYDPWSAYGRSKGSQILSTLSLARKLNSPKYHNIRAYAVHPGMIFETGLAGHLTQEDVVVVGKAFADAGREAPGVKTLEEGLSTILCAVLDSRIEGANGAYLKDCGVAEAAEWVRSEETAERLWRACELLVGERFEW